MDRVQQTIIEHRMIEQGDCIIVGVSGGPDSVALLHLLNELAGQQQCQLHVVHINHMFRAEQSDREADYVSKWAEQLGLPFWGFKVDVPYLVASEGLSPEEAGHKVRFQCFKQVAADVGANKLALGHHQDDQIESVLMHIIQGCGLDGLAAMPPTDGWIIRPFIQVPKAILIHYCQDNGLTYFEDSTNQETVYLRNKIRLGLLPLLQSQYNPQISQRLLTLQQLAQGDNDFINSQVDHYWAASVEVVDQAHCSWDVTLFLNLHLAIQRRLIRRAYQQLVPAYQSLNFKQVEQLIGLAKGNVGYKKLDLPHNIEAIKQYQQLRLQKKQPQKGEKNLKFAYKWILNEPFYLETQQLLFHGQRMNQPIQPIAEDPPFYHVLLDGDKVPDQLEIRSRMPGDCIQPLGMTGKKKIKDFFIDRKIPIHQRDNIPLVFAGGQLIWIPGYTISEQYRINAQTTTYCALHCQMT